MSLLSKKQNVLCGFDAQVELTSAELRFTAALYSLWIWLHVFSFAQEPNLLTPLLHEAKKVIQKLFALLIVIQLIELKNRKVKSCIKSLEKKQLASVRTVRKGDNRTIL